MALLSRDSVHLDILLAGILVEASPTCLDRRITSGQGTQEPQDTLPTHRQRSPTDDE